MLSLYHIDTHTHAHTHTHTHTHAPTLFELKLLLSNILNTLTSFFFLKLLPLIFFRSTGTSEFSERVNIPNSWKNVFRGYVSEL